jgi:hypothetical protein
MSRADIRTWFIRLVLLALASAAPNAFPLSQMGYGTLHHLALVLILPSAAALLVAWLLLEWRGPRSIAALLLGGAIAGAVATLALEAVRYPGFRLGFMPGNLPRLMGVLLLDRFALGPSTLSDAAGFAYRNLGGTGRRCPEPRDTRPRPRPGARRGGAHLRKILPRQPNDRPRRRSGSGNLARHRCRAEEWLLGG